MFLKFHEHTDGNGRGTIHWNRAHLDGAPYRGKVIPLLKDEEFEELSERVWDTKSDMFDLADPDQRKQYHKVLDMIMAQWCQCLHRQHISGEDENGNPTMFVYIEWAEPYQEISASKLERLKSTTQILEPENRYDQPNRGSNSSQRTLRPSQDVAGQ